MEKTSLLTGFHENKLMDGEPHNEPASARPGGRFHSSNKPPRSHHTAPLASLCFRTAVVIEVGGLDPALTPLLTGDFLL